MLKPEQLNGPQIVRTRVNTFGWRLNGSAGITKGNIIASNGVIHKIDQVLFPPPEALAVLELNGLAMFRKAVRVSGLEPSFTFGDIKGRTIFAPTDVAFQTLGDEVLTMLFEAETGRPYLQALLKLRFCPNITFFTNFIWPKNNTGARQTS